MFVATHATTRYVTFFKASALTARVLHDIGEKGAMKKVTTKNYDRDGRVTESTHRIFVEGVDCVLQEEGEQGSFEDVLREEKARAAPR